MNPVKLYQGPRIWGAQNMSPFCIKLELYLRMADIPYQTRRFNPQRAPKGKMPYVDIDGLVMGDSALILQHLERSRPNPVDAHLDEDQRALGHVVRRMLEEGTYWIGVHDRWVEDNGFVHIKEVFKAILPPVIGPVILMGLRRNIKAAALAQGTSRHGREEIEAFGKADLAAVVRILGDKPYLLGDTPSTVDCTLYGMLMAFMKGPIQTPLRAYGEAQPTLLAYMDRLTTRYFPEGIENLA